MVQRFEQQGLVPKKLIAPARPSSHGLVWAAHVAAFFLAAWARSPFERWPDRAPSVFQTGAWAFHFEGCSPHAPARTVRVTPRRRARWQQRKPNADSRPHAWRAFPHRSPCHENQRPRTATGREGAKRRTRAPTSSTGVPKTTTFWATTGKAIATRNLWISIPNLLIGFAVWLMWGIITVQMLNLGFPFAPAELFTLTAIAGLMGATLRIPASFFIRLSGGRNTIFLTSALLIIPAFITGLALQDKSTPLWVFQLCAFLSGIGGGNFACSMSNISGFYPKSQQGTALGMNAGLGNFGVTTMQVLIPLAMTAAVFGTFGGESMTLIKDSGWILGKITAGTETWIQNAGFIWAAILVPLVIAAWFGMNNLMPLSPNYGGTLAAFAKILYLWVLTSIIGLMGLYLYLPAPTGLGLLNMWVALPLIVVVTVVVMKLAAFGEMKANIGKQYAIFGNKHTWSMTALYIVTFGSFIGFSMALPLSITVIFGFQHVLDPATGLMTTR
jgi:MFS transporter, NNP family, nitrate/nitrite transporter